jgi:hypothetical protein
MALLALFEALGTAWRQVRRQEEQLFGQLDYSVFLKPFLPSALTRIVLAFLGPIFPLRVRRVFAVDYPDLLRFMQPAQRDPVAQPKARVEVAWQREQTGWSIWLRDRDTRRLTPVIQTRHRPTQFYQISNITLLRAHDVVWFWNQKRWSSVSLGPPPVRPLTNFLRHGGWICAQSGHVAFVMHPGRCVVRRVDGVVRMRFSSDGDLSLLEATGSGLTFRFDLETLLDSVRWLPGFLPVADRVVDYCFDRESDLWTVVTREGRWYVFLADEQTLWASGFVGAWTSWRWVHGHLLFLGARRNQLKLAKKTSSSNDRSGFA